MATPEIQQTCTMMKCPSNLCFKQSRTSFLNVEGPNCKYRERERESTKFIAQLCLSRLLFKRPPPGFGILFPTPNSPGRWASSDPDPLLISSWPRLRPISAPGVSSGFAKRQSSSEFRGFYRPGRGEFFRFLFSRSSPRLFHWFFS